MSALHLRLDVTIGSLRPESAQLVYRWMCDPVVSENLGLRSTPSLEKTVQWIERAQDDTSLRVFAIQLVGEHVGNVVIDRIDTYLATGRLSVYVGETSVRGAGVGITGMYLAMQQAFRDLDLHKIWLTVHARHFLAINAYDKLGFRLEGILRDEFWLNNERLPALYMGLMRTDFERLLVKWW